MLSVHRPHILFINPWIHDFAAYDFWAKPLGLLTLAALIRQHDFEVSYIDCLDRFHPRTSRTDPSVRFGRGPYRKRLLRKPAGLEDVPRRFSRYGIEPDWLLEDLKRIGTPDLIMSTSLMTYWYPGVQETIETLRRVFPKVPVVLGGIYASLCRSHAAESTGADEVCTGPAEPQLAGIIRRHTGATLVPKLDPLVLDTYPYPALDLQTLIAYAPLLTSRGCPFRCAYCASSILEPRRLLRSPPAVVSEIAHWHHRHGVVDFVLYDDAFLVDAERHAIPILEKIVASGLPVRFHTPNAVHIRGIDPLTARLMFKAGFETLRLGLETADFDHRNHLDNKVRAHEFQAAVNCLKRAGFSTDQVGVYLLAGLPGQKAASVAESIRFVKRSGLKPIVAQYTPIPQTPMWPQAVASSRYDLEADPVFTNNAVFPCRKEPFSWRWVAELKALAQS
jgi:radical SAM superfamily enzyme YgiQ (UPF0313 family)